FKGDSSLATYLSVVARRVCVREIVRKQLHSKHEHGSHNGAAEPIDHASEKEVDRIVDRDEIARMMQMLDERESHVVRMYHFEGKSYQEIAAETGVPTNSIGPILHRAKEKLRTHHAESHAG
ncbi:MAG TPA: sigma-70 family RNA polymerase sigma factor, partial [Pirellulales bacterium]